MKRVCLSLMAMLVLGGCSSESTEFSVDGGFGYVALDCGASDETIARAAVAITVPEKGDFSLTIRGVDVDYERSWTKFSDFVSADTRLVAGNYTASVAWGDGTQEGVNKPCYAGSQAFRIEAQRVTPATVTAYLGNAQVLVTFTRAFTDYFHDELFTLTSAAGHAFEFTAASEDAVFIAPGRFTLTGRALTQNGAEFAFPEQSRNAEARYRYTYKFDLSTVGKATVTISLDDTVIEEVVIDTELNPES
ncbi:DUF4493 domain-containing protein [uncultured Alistipes sp.]|uniref:DUF4493 domain-containing protein n=1 Tax=uncultured Alistipes sp. TaxID=538949 RepID=UPI0032B212CA